MVNKSSIWPVISLEGSMGGCPQIPMIECFSFVIDLTGHFEHSKEDKAQVDGGIF